MGNGPMKFFDKKRIPGVVRQNTLVPAEKHMISGTSKRWEASVKSKKKKKKKKKGPSSARQGALHKSISELNKDPKNRKLQRIGRSKSYPKEY